MVIFTSCGVICFTSVMACWTKPRLVLLDGYFVGLKRKQRLRTFRACGHFGPFGGVPECPQRIFSKFFFRFYENYFPEFLHLINLFDDYLCFNTYLKQLNFFADIPVRGHSGPLQTFTLTSDRNIRSDPVT